MFAVELRTEAGASVFTELAGVMFDGMATFVSRAHPTACIEFCSDRNELFHSSRLQETPGINISAALDDCTNCSARGICVEGAVHS